MLLIVFQFLYNIVSLISDYSCHSYRFEDQPAIHPDIYSLDENDTDRTDSLWNHIGIKYMDGYWVSNDE